MAFCPACGSGVPDGSAFCGKCGAKLDTPPQKKICPNCKNEMAADMMFCDKCGTKYTAPAPCRPYAPPAQQPASHQDYAPQPKYTSEHIYAPVVNTGTLTMLSIACLLLCWPVAIYGFVCQSRAKNAATQEEANSAIRKGKRVCGIAIFITVIVWFLILWGNGVINW